MMKLRNGALALMFAAVMFVSTGVGSANAQTASINDMLTMIQNLMTQIEQLQKQLNTVKSEVKNVLKEGLREGMTDADIAKLQELLATDPTIYPEGKKTGYYGPLTKEAVKRLQARHGVIATGVIDEETHDLLEGYLREVFGERIPPGLLRAPGIMKKVEARLALGCDKEHGGGKGMGPLCKKLKMDHSDDKDKKDKKDEFDVEVTIDGGTTTVEFEFHGVDHEVTVDSTDEDDVLDAVADELNKDVDNLDEDLVDAISDELADAKDGDDEDEDFNVEVDIDGGTTTVSFDFDGDDYEVTVDSTNEDDILDAVADELDEDVADLDEDLVDAISDELADAKGEDDEEAEDNAEEAINDAQDAIEEAEDAINDANGDTSDADDLIDEANDKLDEAEDAFDDEDYEDAEELADEAKELAEDAEDAL